MTLACTHVSSLISIMQELSRLVDSCRSCPVLWTHAGTVPSCGLMQELSRLVDSCRSCPVLCGLMQELSRLVDWIHTLNPSTEAQSCISTDSHCRGCVHPFVLSKYTQVQRPTVINADRTHGLIRGFSGLIREVSLYCITVAT